MNQPLRALVSIAAATAAAIVISVPSLAHSGEWGVFPDPPRSWPGAAIHVRGDVPSTGPIELVLVGPGSIASSIATIDDAPNGHFETTLTLPGGLSPGAWTLEARAPGMETATARLELLAAPPPGPGEGGDTAASAAPVAPAADNSGIETAQPPSPTSGEVDVVPLVAAGLAAAALAVLLRRTRTAARPR